MPQEKTVIRKALKMKKHLTIKLNLEGCHMTVACKEKIWKQQQTMSISVAPGEGHKPIGILTDEHFEEMCNPTKYPGGRFGLMSKRSS